MLYALATLAFAFPADAAPAECAVATLSRSVPDNGATDVPVDIAPLLIFRGSCGVAAPYTLTVFEGAATEPLHEEVYDFAAFTSAGEDWLLEADFGTLTADTAYTVVMASDWGESTQFGFTTGSGTVTPIMGGVPGLSVDFASQTKLGSGMFTTSVEVTLTSAGDGEGVYVLREGGQDRMVVVKTGDTDAVSLEWPSFEPISEVCLSTIERDGIGNWHGPSDEVCASVASNGGCSHSTPWLAGWLVLPLLGLRRRA